MTKLKTSARIEIYPADFPFLIKICVGRGKEPTNREIANLVREILHKANTNPSALASLLSDFPNNSSLPQSKTESEIDLGGLDI